MIYPQEIIHHNKMVRPTYHHVRRVWVLDWFYMHEFEVTWTQTHKVPTPNWVFFRSKTIERTHKINPKKGTKHPFIFYGVKGHENWVLTTHFHHWRFKPGKVYYHWEKIESHWVSVASQGHQTSFLNIKTEGREGKRERERETPPTHPQSHLQGSGRHDVWLSPHIFLHDSCLTRNNTVLLFERKKNFDCIF